MQSSETVPGGGVSLAVMRMVFAIVAALVLSAAPSVACPQDRTYIVSGGVRLPQGQRPDGQFVWRAMLPPNPSLYVHVGHDSEAGFPTFIRPDGTPIATVVRDVVFDGEDGVRVDLDAQDGIIVVRLPSPGSQRAVEIVYVISAFVTPTTRSVELGREGSLEIDSDAALFRIDHANGDSELISNWGRLWLSTSPGFRVVALYPDRREEMIYGRPIDPGPADAAWGLLALLAVLPSVVGRRRAGHAVGS
jgi:hypothetical protein